MSLGYLLYLGESVLVAGVVFKLHHKKTDEWIEHVLFGGEKIEGGDSKGRGDWTDGFYCCWLRGAPSPPLREYGGSSSYFPEIRSVTLPQ